MAPRKRGHDEVDSTDAVSQEPSVLEKIRNMWEFASLAQYIFTFGSAVKLDDDFDIEVSTRACAPQCDPYLACLDMMLTLPLQDLETECVKPEKSDKLDEIGLTLLKWISSFRGLK